MASPPAGRLSLVAGLALLAGGCGSAGSGVAAPPTAATAVDPGSTSGSAVPGAPAAPAEPAPPSTVADIEGSILPSVRLTDLRSGGLVDLASLVPAERPVLLWFWAPH